MRTGAALVLAWVARVETIDGDDAAAAAGWWGEGTWVRQATVEVPVDTSRCASPFPDAGVLGQFRDWVNRLVRRGAPGEGSQRHWMGEACRGKAR